MKENKANSKSGICIFHIQYLGHKHFTITSKVTECRIKSGFLIMHRLRIQTAGLAFGGTGLCSYRVRGVGGSSAEHLTVESYTIIISLQSYFYYWYSITHSLFHSRPKSFLFSNPP